MCKLSLFFIELITRNVVCDDQDDDDTVMVCVCVREVGDDLPTGLIPNLVD